MTALYLQVLSRIFAFLAALRPSEYPKLISVEHRERSAASLLVFCFITPIFSASDCLFCYYSISRDGVSNIHEFSRTIAEHIHKSMAVAIVRSDNLDHFLHAACLVIDLGFDAVTVKS